MMKKVTPAMGIEVPTLPPSHTHTLTSHTLTHTPSPRTQTNDAQVVEIHNDRTETYLAAIRPQIGPHLQLVVVVFPTSRDDRYSAIKKLCCVEKPVPSQVGEGGGWRRGGG